jgi:hypothetical protein
MKSKSGKSNLDIVRNYLKGERPFTTIGYDQNSEVSQLKEGSEWTDSEGKRWVKKNGYKQRVSIAAQRVLETRCKVCNADMKWGSRLDDKIYPKTGRCYDCNISFEAELKLINVYKDYEKFKVLNNESTFLSDLKAKIEESIKYLENSENKLQFFNEDGTNEHWIDDTARRNELLKELRRDLKTTEQLLAKASEELSTCKYTNDVEDSIYKKVKSKLSA